MGSNVTDVGLEKSIEERELKKHVATIHCSNTLSLLQRKISNALLYHAYKELLVKEEHEISIKQLCRLISYNGNNHTAIKEALKGLISTVIEWNVVDDSTGVEDWTASSMIASVSMTGPLCLYAYSPRMKQLLHSPSMFGKINLVIQSRFKSSYGLALYENCIRYCGLPYTKWFDMETFRKLMGVPEGKYAVFRDFKKRVLDKSVEEVNTYSDLIVESEIVREGRQVTRVRFSLQDRAKKVRLGGTKMQGIEQPPDLNGEIIKDQLIQHYGLSLEQVQNVMTEYTHDFISEKMTLIESSRNYRQGKVQNLAAYLFSALKNNFQPTNGVKNNPRKNEDLSESMQLKRIVEEIRGEYLVYRENKIDEMIQDLPLQQKQSFMKEFTEHAEHTLSTILRLQKNKYTTKTVLQSPQIKALIRQFALEKLAHIKQALVTLEDYIEGLSTVKRDAWKQIQSIPSII